MNGPQDLVADGLRPGSAGKRRTHLPCRLGAARFGDHLAMGAARQWRHRHVASCARDFAAGAISGLQELLARIWIAGLTKLILARDSSPRTKSLPARWKRLQRKWAASSSPKMCQQCLPGAADQPPRCNAAFKPGDKVRTQNVHR